MHGAVHTMSGIELAYLLSTPVAFHRRKNRISRVFEVAYVNLRGGGMTASDPLQPYVEWPLCNTTS